MHFKALLGAVTLLTPAGVITGTTPTYSWGALLGAQKYELYVIEKLAPQTRLFTLIVTGTSAQPAHILLPNKEYSTFVRAVDANSAPIGNWGNLDFQISAAPPTDTPITTPTQTPTVTETPAITPTNTPTSTTESPASAFTSSPTSTPTLTPSETPTNTPTNTPTSIPPNTPADTFTPTVTHTSTATTTFTPSNSPKAPHTPTLTPSDTPTQTPTYTPSITNTATNTANITPTPTATPNLEPALFVVEVTCITRNVNGTRTAYFSYNNLTGADITFGTNTSFGTINEFRSSSTTSSPPTTFKAGQSTGSVIAQYNSGTLTWVAKAPGSRLTQATASDASPLCSEVEPLAECRGYESGILRVKLGYHNKGTFEQIFPVGSLNGFAPGGADRGQPNRFFSGLNLTAFEIPLVTPNESITWSINGRSVVVDSTLKTCAGKCIETPAGSIKGELDQVAISLSGLMNRAAATLRSLSGKKGQKGSQARNERDANRAGKKAAEYERIAKALIIQFPAIIKTCPEAPILCTTVDRQGTIDALRGLYANQRNSVKRVMARVLFSSSGKTARRQKFVKEAKILEATGLAQLSKLPRFVSECK